jgi:hypothetical protein
MLISGQPSAARSFSSHHARHLLGGPADIARLISGRLVGGRLVSEMEEGPQNKFLEQTNL